MEETTKILKSCVVAHQGGVPQENLDDEYFKLTGTYIPYLSLGYSSLYEFLGEIKELVKIRNENNALVYTVVEPKTAHIAEMVQNQKKSYGLNGKNHNRAAKRTTNGGNVYSKRKAMKDLSRERRDQKRQKCERRSRASDRNRLFDHVSLEDAETEMDDADSWSNDEYPHPVNICNHPQKLDVLSEPIVNKKLLIGDDFFLQLAIRNVGTTIYRKGPCTALNSGLCKSGQTIKECARTLRKVGVLPSKIVIMLGTEDVYRGHSSNKMIEDMEDLLEYIEATHILSRSAITLCTIPPLANLSMICDREKLANLRRFNNWIRAQTTMSFADCWNSGLRYNVIDFNTKNTTVQGSTDYEYFQLDARMVSGTSHPYVLWNMRGRRLAMNLLRSGS